VSRFRMVLRMAVRPGTEQDFETEWLGVADDIAAHPACLGQTLERSAEECSADAGGTDGSVFYIISDWADEASFRDFARDEIHHQHRARLAPFRLSSSITTMTMVRHLRQAAVGAGSKGE
jgi:heme-degrading monooxygenase HmoA